MNTSRLLRLSFLPLAALFAGRALAETKPAEQPAPAAHCPVSAEELGSMGKPYIHVHKEEGKPDREVALCCKMCVGKFESDPAKYLAIVDAEKAADHAKSKAPAAPAPHAHQS